MSQFSRALSLLNKSMDNITLVRGVFCAEKPSWKSFQSLLDAWETSFKRFRTVYLISEISILSPQQRKLFDAADVRYGLLFQLESQDLNYRKFLWKWVRSKSFKLLTEKQKTIVRVTLSGTLSARWPAFKKNLLNSNLAQQQQLEQQFRLNVKRDQSNLGVYAEKLGDLRHLPIAVRRAAAKQAKDNGWTGWWFEATEENARLFKNSSFVHPNIKRQMTIARSKVGVSGEGINDNNFVLTNLAELRRHEGRIYGEKSYGDYHWSSNVLNSPRKMKHFLTKKHNELLLNTSLAPRKSIQLAYGNLKCKPQHAQDLLATLWDEWLGVTFKETPSPKWASDSRSFKLFRNGSLVGTLTLDLFSRTSKPTSGLSGFFVDIQHKYTYADGKKQLPHALIAMNTSPESWDHNDVLTFFHEMGHALHFFSSDGDCSPFFWDCIEGDAVEWPSMFMESWGWDKRSTAALFGATGQRICSRMKSFKRQHFINTGLQVSWIDMAMHSSQHSKDEQTNRWFDLMASRSMRSEMLPKFDYARWEHLSMMKGAYAGYLWGDDIGRKVYKKLRFADKSVWNSFWDTVLKPSGTMYVQPLLESFLAAKK
jgi:Zn-dependent oligopeptidase